MTYDLIKISALPAATPDESQEIVVGVGDLAKRINYGDVKADMVGTSPTYTTDTEPYLMRQTAHFGVVGKCALNKLVGGSLGWNQLIPIGSSGTVNGITFTSNGNGSWAITGTSTAANTFKNLNYATGTYRWMTNHVYFVSGAKTPIYIEFMNDGGVSLRVAAEAIVKPTASLSSMPSSWVRWQIANSGTTVSETLTPQLIDLTAMFGSTIADYVYSLEQATSGSGIAWLSKYIDLSTYHAYDAGSIQSVQTTAHVTTGKNLLEVTGATTTRSGITFAPQTDGSIVCNGTATALVQFVITATFSQTGNFILSGCPSGGSTSKYDLRTDSAVDGGSAKVDFGTGIAFSKGTHENTQILITIRSGYVCDNLVFRPMIRLASVADATYEPYTAHNYPLGSDTLRGIPQLVSNKLSYDGDEKYPDGTIKRKYGIVDMGSLSWAYNSGSGDFAANISAKALGITNIICAKYPTVDYATVASMPDKSIKGNSGNTYISVKDSAYSTAAAFKTAMSGVYLVYELATPTTESSTSYQKIQTIDADGTESFTTSSPVPVGHETQTPDNILAALEWLGE